MILGQSSWFIKIWSCLTISHFWTQFLIDFHISPIKSKLKTCSLICTHDNHTQMWVLKSWLRRSKRALVGARIKKVRSLKDGRQITKCLSNARVKKAPERGIPSKSAYFVILKFMDFSDSKERQYHLVLFPIAPTLTTFLLLFPLYWRPLDSLKVLSYRTGLIPILMKVKSSDNLQL